MVTEERIRLKTSSMWLNVSVFKCCPIGNVLLGIASPTTHTNTHARTRAQPPPPPPLETCSGGSDLIEAVVQLNGSSTYSTLFQATVKWPETFRDAQACSAKAERRCPCDMSTGSRRQKVDTSTPAKWGVGRARGGDAEETRRRRGGCSYNQIHEGLFFLLFLSSGNASHKWFMRARFCF